MEYSHTDLYPIPNSCYEHKTDTPRFRNTTVASQLPQDVRMTRLPFLDYCLVMRVAHYRLSAKAFLHHPHSKQLLVCS